MGFKLKRPPLDETSSGLEKCRWNDNHLRPYSGGPSVAGAAPKGVS